MQFPRYTESWLRQLLKVLPIAGSSADPRDLAKRLEQLKRHLEPEDEFALILSWLGKCRLVHKLSQEQLPLRSTEAYKVPDLLAVFDYQGEPVSVLIEVKTTEPSDPLSLKPEILSGLKPGYLRYADTIGLPMLVAWRHRTFWTLFEMRHATLAKVNYKIDFFRAMEENLLGLLAGDFSYRVAPGTAIRMRIAKLSEPDADGSFEGMIRDVHVVNSAGERVPDFPHLISIFLFWDNDIEQVDEGDTILQSFVIRDTGLAELASRTLSKIVQSFAALRSEEVDWSLITHDREHWAHRLDQFQENMSTAATHGVLVRMFRSGPNHHPAFLNKKSRK